VQKTFCDRCGTECTNFIFHLEGSIRHITNRGENVGYEGMKGLELCRQCTDQAKELLGLVFVLDEDSYDKAVYVAERRGEPMPDFPGIPLRYSDADSAPAATASADGARPLSTALPAPAAATSTAPDRM